MLLNTGTTARLLSSTIFARRYHESLDMILWQATHLVEFFATFAENVIFFIDANSFRNERCYNDCSSKRTSMMTIKRSRAIYLNNSTWTNDDGKLLRIIKWKYRRNDEPPPVRILLID